MMVRPSSSTQPADPWRSGACALGGLMALIAALHKMLYASVLVNDDFMHRTYALQLLAGERPVGDFFDYGMGLMYAASALAQSLFGYRLFSEAMLIGVMVAVSTFLVFAIVWRASQSVFVAALSAALLVVAMPRGYGYPKLVVYAVAAALWWRYVRRPDMRGALLLGTWAAIAFYWRPDHGAYVAVGVMLAILAAHGVSRETGTRCLQAGLVTLMLVAPWLVYASIETGGLGAFVRSGLTAAFEEHRAGQTAPRWPLRRPNDFLRVDANEQYAPTIGIRWTGDSSPALRQHVTERYGLTVVANRSPVSQEVRLSARTLLDLRGLLAEPAVEDTDGIDRGAAQLLESTWPSIERWRFRQWWLRLNALPALDDQGEAGEAATILMFAWPLFTVLAAVWMRGSLPAGITPAQVACFGIFAVIVDFGVLRAPFHVRVADSVVLPAIAMGLFAATLLRATRQARGYRRWLPYAMLTILIVLTMKSLAVAGQSGERVTWLAGGWRSLERARGAWEEVSGRLLASPPIDYWRNRKPEVTLRLAAYAHECVPERDRILVLWFAPEIYYYANRLMAGRHLFFLAEFGTLPHERRMELDKITRHPPEVIFAKSMLDEGAGTAFPELLDLIANRYHVGGFVDDGERYLILVRNDRAPTRTYGAGLWPCYR